MGGHDWHLPRSWGTMCAAVQHKYVQTLQASKTDIDQQENTNRFYSDNALLCSFLWESHGSRNRGRIHHGITLWTLRHLECKAMQKTLEYGDIYGYISFEKHHSKSQHMSACFILGVIYRTSILPWSHFRGPKKVQNLIKYYKIRLFLPTVD